MKIEQVKVILTSPNQNYLFVKLITDSGVYGVGDASLNGQEHTVADFITSFLTPQNSFQHGGLSPAPGGFAVRDG